MLELYFDEVGVVGVARDVGQPVVGVQLTVLPPYSLMAESAVATGLYLIIFHLFTI